jgi:hypothetical protein
MYGYKETFEELKAKEERRHTTGVQGFFMTGLLHVLRVFYRRMGGDEFWKGA